MSMTLVRAALAALCGAALCAHDPGLSALAIVRDGDALAVTAAFANADFAAVSGADRDGDAAVDADELSTFARTLPAWIVAHFEVAAPAGGGVLVASEARIAPNGDVELALRWRAGCGPITVALPLLADLAHGHRCYARVLVDGHLVADALLHRAARALLVPPCSESARGFGQGAAFFALGVEHILFGFDHLAFLLALLAAGVTLRRALATITAFTLAHSATLLGAAFDVVRLPGALVEAAIAASIVVVALLNVVQRATQAPHRWPLAFVFGLIHGFGFAGALAELQAGGDVVLPTIAFNLGVEAGQLAFAAVAVPLLAVAARRWNARAVAVWPSAAVGAAGAVWLVARLGA